MHISRAISPPRVSNQKYGHVPSEAKSSSDICTVCLTNERTHAFVPCGHLACCVTCIKRLEAKRCPICNDPKLIFFPIIKKYQNILALPFSDSPCI
ncbi:hypothetical protein PUN28_020357 [Cardiocondyla obscurior]|uniref:RING-type domain-containing protein n=1 Tax=Cardiocondyla obscurior TaxID=286306 RepID=A0AAW2E816_9HYME